MKFLLLTLLSTIALAAPKISFHDSYDHYVSGHDMLRLLAQKFPKAATSPCIAGLGGNRAILGLSTPSTGSPTFRGPTPSFVKWYASCVATLIDAELDQVGVEGKGFSRFFGTGAIAALGSSAQAAAVQNPKSVAWGTIDPAIRLQIISNLIRDFIGPEVVQNEGLLSIGLDKVAVKKSGLSTFDAFRKIIRLIVLRDEFLTY